MSYKLKTIIRFVIIILIAGFLISLAPEVLAYKSEDCPEVQEKDASFRITYVLDGGTNHKDNPESYDKQHEDITLLPATRKGYAFEGWYTDKDMKKKIEKIAKGQTGDLTLYAKWAAVYYLTLDGNGADSGSMWTKKTLKAGTEYALDANKYKKKGYTFKGWNTKKDGSGNAYADKAKIKDLSAKPGGAVTLYAQWKKNKKTKKETETETATTPTPTEPATETPTQHTHSWYEAGRQWVTDQAAWDETTGSEHVICVTCGEDLTASVINSGMGAGAVGGYLAAHSKQHELAGEVCNTITEYRESGRVHHNEIGHYVITYACSCGQTKTESTGQQER